jgi:hypothetical protein
LAFYGQGWREREFRSAISDGEQTLVGAVDERFGLTEAFQ